MILLSGKMNGLKAVKELMEDGKDFGDIGQVDPFKVLAGRKNHQVCAFLRFSSSTAGLLKAVCVKLNRNASSRLPRFQKELLRIKQ
jgi:hypothetical protein